MSRYIDEGKAKKILKGLLYETAMNNIRQASVYEDIAKNRMDIWFTLIPTVDAEPIRHGKWKLVVEQVGNGYEVCSCCGYHHFGGDDKYCPHCGAKMDEDKPTFRKLRMVEPTDRAVVLKKENPDGEVTE